MLKVQPREYAGPKHKQCNDDKNDSANPDSREDNDNYDNNNDDKDNNNNNYVNN